MKIIFSAGWPLSYSMRYPGDFIYIDNTELNIITMFIYISFLIDFIVFGRNNKLVDFSYYAIIDNYSSWRGGSTPLHTQYVQRSYWQVIATEP